VHCYSNSQNIKYSDELSTEEGKALISDLASFGCPVILFSGGEPLMREDLPELVRFAVDSGIRAGYFNKRYSYHQGKGRNICRYRAFIYGCKSGRDRRDSR